MTNPERFKQILEARLIELNERAEELDEDLGEPADDDWSENAQNSENDEVLEKLGSMALDEIRQIKSALSRIKTGKYGVCEECGKEIAVKRMEAVPHASKCVKCA